MDNEYDILFNWLCPKPSFPPHGSCAPAAESSFMNYCRRLSMRHLITEMQSLGIRVHKNIQGRKGGAGPSEGKSFLIGGIPVNAPIAGHYVSQSPFCLETADDSFVLLKHGKAVSPLEVVPEPAFYGRFTQDGVAFRNIALLHGRDCLATTVLQQCVHWKRHKKCGFCSTETSLKNKETIARKSPEQLAEVARAARDLDGVSHMVLTSGTGDPAGSEILYLSDCVRAIKAEVEMPVQVQFAPPGDLDLMDALKDAGVDAVGIHVESFDLNVLSRIAPAKAEIGMLHYERAWKKAVELFGPGRVSSFLIAGLGETSESIAWGSEFLADLGVYPFVVPLRPLPGSSLENAIPPDPETMKRIYDAVSLILQKKGISTKDTMAGCVRCGACSALGAYEKNESKIICHSARTSHEREAAFKIRTEVFVNEQGMFSVSDRDENDSEGILLVAKTDDRVIGTVRVFPGKTENGHWIGGRLAVQKEYRTGRTGSLLVKEAMKRVKKKGCSVFTAEIQEKNVRFFKKLGWQPAGPAIAHFGFPHQPMRADLSLVPGDL
jgi:radical SAM protein (TIGR04043 family)/putative N-acetyltransferase (TIGR04045 family)